MVKVEELTTKEREQEQRISKLVEIAKEVLPDYAIGEPYGTIFNIKSSDGGYFTVDLIMSGKRVIKVDKPENFDDAMKLAQAYEQRTDYGEFIVKKQYED